MLRDHPQSRGALLEGRSSAPTDDKEHDQEEESCMDGEDDRTGGGRFRKMATNDDGGSGGGDNMLRGLVTVSQEGVSQGVVGQRSKRGRRDDRESRRNKSPCCGGKSFVPDRWSEGGGFMYRTSTVPYTGEANEARS